MGTRVLLFTLIRMVVNTAHRMVYPFLNVFALSLGVELSAISLALTGRAAVGGLSPLLGWVADRYSRKIGIILGLLIFTIGVSIVVIRPTFRFFVLSLMLTTLGKYVLDPSMHAYLGDHVPYEKRGMSIGILEMGWSLGFIAGVPLVAFLIARDGWLTPFPLLIILGVLSILAILKFVPQEDVSTKCESGEGLSVFRNVFAYPSAVFGLSVGLLMSAGNEMVNLIFGVWLGDVFGLEIIALGGASLVIGVSEFLGESAVSRFTDRLGKKRAISLGLAISSLTAIFLPIFGRDTYSAIAILFLFYLTFEFSLVSSISLMTEVYPKARATLLTINIAGLSLGRAVAALVAPGAYSIGISVNIIIAFAFNLLAIVLLQKVKVPAVSHRKEELIWNP